MIIDLNYNNTYKWYSDNKHYAIGYIYYKNKFYKQEQLINLIKTISKKDLKKFISEIDGSFLFIINYSDEYIIVSDLLRTFPLFYKKEDNKIFVFDNIMKYKTIIDKVSEKELLSLGYVTENNTIFEDIFQIEAHQILTINKKKHTIKTEKYFEYRYDIKAKSENQMIKELDEIYNNVIKRMIKYLDGRTAIVPLSGGNDSRLIAYYLKKNNYNNIITYTYGNSSNSELETSKKVAEFLNLPWHFIEYKNESMQNKFNDEKIYGEMADYCGRGISVPIIQEWEAISELDRLGLINKESSVAIPGYTGDFVNGSHISEYLYINDYLTFDQLEQHIYKRHYVYTKEELSDTLIKNKLDRRLKIKAPCKKNNKNDNIEIYESFDFEERQSKYITNAVRIFDFQGLQWYLPFWDKELVQKWLTIPIEKKYKQNLFNKFTMSIYNDLMEYAPIHKEKVNSNIKNIPKVLKYFYKFFDRYKNGFLNFYGYFYFKTYLLYFLKTGFIDYNRMFAEHYKNYIKRR